MTTLQIILVVAAVVGVVLLWRSGIVELAFKVVVVGLLVVALAPVVIMLGRGLRWAVRPFARPRGRADGEFAEGGDLARNDVTPTREQIGLSSESSVNRPRREQSL